ncbi:MAG: DNA/RNA helicase domain-containing protein [Candidatus Omnitrophota bacterium]
MRLYEGSIKEFSADVIHNRIADILRDNFLAYYRRIPSEPEFRSWQQSLNFLNNAFTYSALTNNKVIVEYELPYSTRRIDVLIFGKNNASKDSVVLMELKQWSNEHVYDCENEGNIIIDFYGKKEVAHPCLQVEGYSFDLQDFLTVFSNDDPIHLNSCTYCHNYSKQKENILSLPKFHKFTKTFPLFLKEDVRELGLYLQDRLENSDGLEVFNRFLNSPVRPSKRLLDHTGDMIHKQQIFTLIDDQIAAYNAIMSKAKQLSKTSTKSIIVVKGGPGTGKSVIALEVMGELMRQGKVVYHATGSSAFTNTLRKIVGRRASNLFKFFFNFTQHEENEIDVLICDEAHRIRSDSNDYGVPSKFRSKKPQVEDLIRPAKLSIFFIDEFQIVRPKEIGSVELIKSSAAKLGVKNNDIAEFELRTQFRCSGSDAYLQWLDKLLKIRESDIDVFDAKMEFRIFDTPVNLKKAIDEKNRHKENSARVVAGFCWKWSEPNRDGSLVRDVQIGDFQMPWEKKDEFWKWATDKSGMEQVGTVYTAQGFEFDYIGVIFGDDLVWRKDKGWVSIPENSFDSQVLRGNQKLTDHLKHVYRVLMSRAHKGVYIYFMDKETEAYFRSKIDTKEGALKFSDIIKESKEEVRGLVSEVSENLKFKDYLPVLDLEAVATSFGKETQVEQEPKGWIKADIPRTLNKDMFVAKVVGKSMEPTIPDGSYCVFRFDKGGTRNGLVVLVECRLVSDPETTRQFTIKRYKSEKEYFDDGTWRHKIIILSPDNNDFKDIVLEDVPALEFRVVAELVAVL